MRPGLWREAACALLAVVSLMSAVAVPFLGYQRRWIDDPSPLMVALKARQTGFTEATAFKIAIESLSDREDWFYMSRSDRQVKEAVLKIRRHFTALEIATEMLEQEYSWEGGRYLVHELRAPNGSRVFGFPFNPDTVRSFSGNIVLDEFGIAPAADSWRIWAAMIPTITWGYKVIVLSTPQGKRGKFYDIWTRGKGWSRHSVDIYQAVAEGHPADVDTLREAVNDPDAWAQEYELKFLDEAHSWLPYDLIDRAESPLATMELPVGFGPLGPCYLGVDIARRRHLTVLWLNELLGDVHWARSVQRMHNAPFREQMAAIEAQLPLVRRACIDETGMGMKLVEDLQLVHGSRVEGVTFSGPVKKDLATRAKKLYEDGRVRVPFDPQIRNDLHSVKRVITAAGNERFDAESTDKSHADHFWAQALALMASDAGQVSFAYRGGDKYQSAGLVGSYC